MCRSLRRVAAGATARLYVRFCTSSLSNNNADKIPNSSTNEEATLHQQRTRPLFEYDELQARVLQASLAHVNRLGWSESTIIAGAEDVGVSPAIARSFPRKGATLVEYFMDDCLQKLINNIESREEVNVVTLMEKYIFELITVRLMMQAPYISRWAEALAIQAQPANVPTSIKQREMLINEIWCAAKDGSDVLHWYAHRNMIGAAYSVTEMFMLSDRSPGFQDSANFFEIWYMMSSLNSMSYC